MKLNSRQVAARVRVAKERKEKGIYYHSVRSWKAGNQPPSSAKEDGSTYIRREGREPGKVYQYGGREIDYRPFYRTEHEFWIDDFVRQRLYRQEYEQLMGGYPE